MKFYYKQTALVSNCVDHCPCNSSKRITWIFHFFGNNERCRLGRIYFFKKKRKKEQNTNDRIVSRDNSVLFSR